MDPSFLNEIWYDTICRLFIPILVTDEIFISYLNWPGKKSLYAIFLTNLHGIGTVSYDLNYRYGALKCMPLMLTYPRYPFCNVLYLCRQSVFIFIYNEYISINEFMIYNLYVKKCLKINLYYIKKYLLIHKPWDVFERIHVNFNFM